jgi:hypothetical protein
MNAGFADHVMNEGHVISAEAEWRDDITEPLAALTIGFEVPHRFFPGAESVLEGFNGFSKICILSMMFDESGFEIKEVDMTGGTAHEELHHALGFWCHGKGALRSLRSIQGAKGDGTEALTGSLKKLAACDHVGLVDEAELVEIEDEAACVFESFTFGEGSQWSEFVG